MKKDVIVKLSIFSIICIGFILIVIYYSNALPKSQYGKFEDWVSNTFTHSDTSKEIIEKSFVVNPGGILLTETDGSDIDIETWDKNEVHVYIEKRGDKERCDNFKVTFCATPDRVEIYGKNERNFWNWGNFSVYFKIKVPKNFNPNLSTSGGDIEIADLKGAIIAHTSGGDIKTTKTEGNLKAKTSGGSIVVNGIKGDIEINTSGGNIKLFEIDGKIYGQTSGGNIEIELMGENQGIELRTSGGNIRALLPESIKADLDCSTSGGHVSLNIPGGFSGKIEDEEIKGSFNGGGNSLILKTSGGNIKLNSTKKE